MTEWVLVLDEEGQPRRYVSDVEVRWTYWKQAGKWVLVWYPVLSVDLLEAVRYPIEETAVNRVRFLKYGQPEDLIRAQPYAVRRVLKDATGEWTR